MLVGGAAIIFVQLTYSPIIFFKLVAGAGILVVLAMYLFWEDFLKPKPKA
jgi:hypothetical protein